MNRQIIHLSNMTDKPISNSGADWNDMIQLVLARQRFSHVEMFRAAHSSLGALSLMTICAVLSTTRFPFCFCN